MRIRLDLAYLGTRFEGWQVQETLREGQPPRTVQGDLESALSNLYKAPVRVHGAGRTDSGVHADGQVAHFDVAEGAPRIPPKGIQNGLNSMLAEDVRVLAATAVPDSFHARFSAAGKIYVYRLRRGELLHPLHGLIEALAPEPLDVTAMREAAGVLVGRRDFAAFSLKGSEVASTVRHLVRLDVEEQGTLLLITAEADGFLRGMVRRLAGTLRDVGRGRTDAKDVLDRPGPTAEARGLTLQRVVYPPEG